MPYASAPTLAQVLTGYLVPYGRSTVSDAHLLLASSSEHRRICARWHQRATGTGRISCTHPNLQAMPKSSTNTGPTMQEETKEDEGSENEAEEEEEQPYASAASSSSRQAPPPSPVASPSMPFLSSPVIQLDRDQQACPIRVPTDVNIRASIVPTPSAVVQQVCRDRHAAWDAQGMHVVRPPLAAIASRVPADEERCILAADFSQMEVRLLAQLSKDERLIRVFNPAYRPMSLDEDDADAGGASGADADVSTETAADLATGDVYRRMASVMFQRAASDVTTAERSISKTIVLGVMYGMGTESLAAKLTKFDHRPVSKTEAQGYIKKLYEQFPQIGHFMAQTKADAAQNVRADQNKTSGDGWCVHQLLALS